MVNGTGKDGTEPNPPARGAILLGASNLSRSLPLVCELARSLAAEPLQLYIAAGHGRSYGWRSRVLVRGLPGIRQCGLWQALPERFSSPPWGLVTDVGNDLMYGAAPAQIVDWVAECLTQLRQREARLVVTRLPLARLQQLDRRTFVVMQTMLFPGNRTPPDVLLQRAAALDAQLAAVAQEFGATVVAPQAQWYGIDPIHVLRRAASAAWSTILAPWLQEEAPDEPRVGAVVLDGAEASRRAREKKIFRARRFFFLAPHERTWCGWVQRRAQPALRARDGSGVWLY